MGARMAGYAGSGRGVRPVASALVLVAAAGVLVGCAAGPNAQVLVGPEGAGFWTGVWHGLILPITFLVSLFTDSVGVYEVRNSGGWYDFGFLVGVVLAFSGPASGRRVVRR